MLKIIAHAYAPTCGAMAALDAHACTRSHRLLDGALVLNVWTHRTSARGNMPSWCLTI
jgi:hypothetical protein